MLPNVETLDMTNTKWSGLVIAGQRIAVPWVICKPDFREHRTDNLIFTAERAELAAVSAVPALFTLEREKRRIHGTFPPVAAQVYFEGRPYGEVYDYQDQENGEGTYHFQVAAYATMDASTKARTQ